MDKLEKNMKLDMTDGEYYSLLAEICVSLITTHYNYGKLGSRIVIYKLHREITKTFSETMEYIQKELNIFDETFYENVITFRDILDKSINKLRDYDIDYFGFKTLEKSYLTKINGHLLETPQYMFMRVALAIHGKNMESVIQTYDDMSSKFYIHATPTLFNTGMKRQQLSSCYLIAMKEDSIDGIYDTLKECALISKWAGGIGVHIHQIRGKDSAIHSSNGKSDGLVPMLKVFNDTARYCNQSGKRPGSFAIYLEPWHSDIEAFLELKKNHGAEEERARDLFYALWIPDLFMKQVESNGDWYLMCPDISKGLSDVSGEKFETLYWSYVERGIYKKKMSARELWKHILVSQIETGTPYMVYKDSSNKKSNQQNLGVIKSSNLCSEIVEYSNAEETAVCNLASLGLPSYIVKDSNNKKVFNHKLLGEKVRQLVRNLNNVIDINYYPTENCKRSNFRHRPIGIGVQGLADVFMELDLDWDSPEARKVNKDIFETIYYYAILESCNLSQERKWWLIGNFEKIEEAIENTGAEFYRDDQGFIHKYEFERIKHRYYVNPSGINKLGAYSSFEGSPISFGKFQFDLWEHTLKSSKYNWEGLKANILTFGIRNSLLTTIMPTASTSQILGFNECIEPITSNIYSRRTMAGEFIVMNKRLMKDLLGLGIWSRELKDKIIENDGSIQDLSEIPKELKAKYKTVWEIKQKSLIDMSAERGHFICQSQSLNLFLSKIDMNRLGSMHLYAWKQGLKTGMYYLRTRTVAKTQKFTIEPKKDSKEPSKEPTECIMCSS
jgi:ribonucleoside-diphosphate reductase alpha subunit